MTEIKAADLWKNIPQIELSEASNHECFTFSYRQLNKLCEDRLPLLKIDFDYWDSPYMISDLYTKKFGFDLLKALDPKAGESLDGSGWVYIYTHERAIKDAQVVHKNFFSKSVEYGKMRMKIGVTQKHPMTRVCGQQGASSEWLIIPVGIFWSPKIKDADYQLRQMLNNYKARKRGGKEWFELQLEEARSIILDCLCEYRLQPVAAIA